MNKNVLKVIVSIIVLSLISTSTFADSFRTDQGTWTLSGSLMFDPATAGGADYYVSLALGNYIETGFMVGGLVDFNYNDFITALTCGPICKYHFFDNEKTAVSPYVGGFLGIGYMEVYSGNTTALIAGCKLGFDLFVTENVSIDTSIGLYFATDDIYSDKGKMTNTDVIARIGLSLFF